MTVAPDVPALQVGDPAEAIDALRRSGLRISTARRLVIEALFDADGPVSAAQLAQRLSLEESSVYRNLEVLEQHGLARHVHLGHGPGLYVLSGRERRRVPLLRGLRPGDGARTATTSTRSGPRSVTDSG